MQKGKNVSYAMAGVQALPGMRMNVRSNVRVPDSEAGYEPIMERRPYYAEHPAKPVPRQPMTLPTHIGVIFLCIVLVVFGALVISKCKQRWDVSNQITAMENSISATMQQNTQLAVQVMEARDSARISYAAVQNLGMVAATGVDAIAVTAPDTRPYSHTAQTAASPSVVGLGMISGSR